MFDRYKQSEDILFYLRDRHTGAENLISGAKLEYIFGITGWALRQIINKLRCNGQPVCSNVNGYFYAKNKHEINDTVTRLTGREAQGLTLSHQVFCDGLEGDL